MAQAASILLQGLSQGNSRREFDIRQRVVQQQLQEQQRLRLQQAIQQDAARKALLARYDTLSPMPNQFMGAGPAGGLDTPEGMMGPDVNGAPPPTLNPDFEPRRKQREAMSDPNVPVDVLDQMVGAEEGVQKAMRLADFKQQIEDRDFAKEMAVLEGARKMGIGPQHSQRVKMIADKYGVGQDYFDPMGAQTVQGVMNRDPAAIAQMLQHGPIPGGLLPSATQKPQYTPEQIFQGLSGAYPKGDPNVLRGTADLMSKGFPVDRPEVSVSGMTKAPGGSESERLIGRLEESENWNELIGIMQQRDIADQPTMLSLLATEALSRNRVDPTDFLLQRGRWNPNPAFQGSTPAPGPAKPKSATSAPNVSAEDAAAQAWRELGAGVSKEVWKARVAELMGGPR